MAFIESGPGLSTNDRPHATEPQSHALMLMPPSAAAAFTYFPLSFHFHFQASGMVLSLSLVVLSPWLRLLYDFENLSHILLRELKPCTADIT